MVLFPAIRKEFRELASLHGVDSSEDVGKVFARINLVALSRGDKREESSYSFTTSVRAGKEEIFAIENKGFDLPLTCIVIYFDFSIFQEASQCEPVIERVINSLHERMFWSKGAVGAGVNPCQIGWQTR